MMGYNTVIKTLMPTCFRAFFILAVSATGVVLSAAPTAHASWVSKALGLDRHKDPTPMPVTVIQPVYVQPITIAAVPVANPTFLPTAQPIRYVPATPSSLPATLPVTGPLYSVLWQVVTGLLLSWAVAIYATRAQARRSNKDINIV